MAIKTTIGGERLGSGSKMEAYLNDFNRSTHNQSRQWNSSIPVGALIPCFREIATNGDTIEIDINPFLRTVPTKSPILDNLKLQIDFFFCPMRLYQGLLHNNPLAVGLKMNQIYFPQIIIRGKGVKADFSNFEEAQFSHTSLVSFLGIKGLGRTTAPNGACSRAFNAQKILMYMDIVKNFYINKQEKNAYQIAGKVIYPKLAGVEGWNGNEFEWDSDFANAAIEDIQTIRLYGTGKWTAKQFMEMQIEVIDTKTLTNITWPLSIYFTANEKSLQHIEDENGDIVETIMEISVVRAGIEKGRFKWVGNNNNNTLGFQNIPNLEPQGSNNVNLTAFNTEGIDRARQIILGQNELNDIVKICQQTGAPQGIISWAPYETLCAYSGSGLTIKSNNTTPLNGLVVKSYQSDLYNNWLNSETISGANGIANITKVSTSNDVLYLDNLLLAQAIYNMLNQIQVNGGTYEDWQEAAYGEKAIRRAESPIYVGGYASEIGFDEVVSTAASENQPLGSIAGRGNLHGGHGGKVIVKANEPGIIMGIASITPRIGYSQGNDWQNTELITYDDLHKPALDGIGFQDLITEQMAWWDTVVDGGTTTEGGKTTTFSAGKVPAWQHYRTAIDENHGDFADPLKLQTMVFDRRYQYNNNATLKESSIKDLTTAIDPGKFNYAFINTARDAQNFWLKIIYKVESRRKMSTRLIPSF